MGFPVQTAKDYVFELDRKAEKEEEDSGRRSILGLEGIAFAPGREKPSPSPSALLAPQSGGEPEEESDRRSVLGLARIEFSPEWRAAVAASPLRQPVTARRPAAPARPVAPTAAEEDERSHELLFGLERREFAVGGRASSPAAASSDAARGSPIAAAPVRVALLDQELPSLGKPEVPPEIDVPQFEHDLLQAGEQPIPVERAILLSLAAHILIVLLLLLWAPFRIPAASPKGGLFAGLIPEPRPDDKIPIIFRSAPGPQRENPKPSDLSDKTRRAGGGDRSRPKSETPFVARRPGIEGLAPGAGKMAAAPRPRPAPGQAGEKTAAGTSGERAKSAEEGFRVPPPAAGSSAPGAPQIADLQRVIQDAAREVGSQGLGGAGTPNPEGGFVDSGPISFDTTWYDWGPYAEEMVRRIKLHWDIPELARLGWKGRLTVRFFIMADGRVQGAKIVSQSGIPPFDFAALQAILKSDPFKPLPRDLLAQMPGKDREGITVTFFYNIRPERE